jgi:hypothetical protein
MVNPVIKAMSEYLVGRGYIKMNPYLYIKNIKTDIITGNILIVDFSRKTVSTITVNDKFCMCFNKKPTIKINEKQYNTLMEFKRYILDNEKAEVEFLKKSIDWSKTHNE